MTKGREGGEGVGKGGKGMGLIHEVEDPVRSGAQRSAFRPHAE